MTSRSWLPLAGMCVCLSAGCLGGRPFAARDPGGCALPADARRLADGMPTWVPLALAGSYGDYPPPPEPLSASAGRKVSIEAGYGMSFFNSAHVYHLEGVFKLGGRVAFSGYVERMPQAGGLIRTTYTSTTSC